MKNTEQSLYDRLVLVLCDRKIYPWAQSIGISKGTVDSIKSKGGMPGAEVLRAINRCENVSLEWLLDGRGNPFYVTACASDEDARNVLHELLGPETWEATLVSDGDRYAFVLTQPGAFLVKDQEIRYTIMEVITGAIGPKTVVDIRNRGVHLMGLSGLYYVSVDRETMNKLETGQLGTYRICHSDNAVLKTRTLFLANPELVAKVEAFRVMDNGPRTKEEEELLENFRSMSSEGKEAFLKLVETVAAKKN